MKIGARPRRPLTAGMRRGTAGTVAVTALVAAVCGTGGPTAAPDPASATTRTVAASRTKAAGAPTVKDAKPVAGAAGERVDCKRAKCVALTFDDGPGRHTDALLRHLAAYRARATFFVVGRNVAANQAIVRRTYAAGHEIGSHTWSHPDLTTLPAAKVRAQFARTDRAIKAAIGVRPKLVRPPYGAFNAAVRKQTRRPLVMWSVDTLDWLHRDSSRVARKTLKSVRPGSVILFHDIHPTTVAAMPKVLKRLSARGYTFVTVSRLYGGRPPKLVYGR
ncbi:polysaccharide deacetylase family protein [Nonomuraea candida]|uniref:polysaccharide deacetylase family protein n=1 Tax=Nonomuraea candida TaxID=359159 RepID=UPI000A8F48FF|nr:polysaccharide deacetylase family protein [Nonomuraea candida]